MKFFYSDKTFELIYDFSNKVLIQRWLVDASFLWEVEIKEKLFHYIRTIKETGVKKVLIDFRLGTYAITPQLTKWIQNNTLKEVEHLGIKKTAILVSDDFVTAMLTKGIFEVNKSNVKRCFFSSEKEAQKWLNLNSIQKIRETLTLS